MKEQTKNQLILIGRIMAGSLFFFSGLSKLSQPSEFFEVAINFYEIVPYSFVHGAAIIIPWVELIFGTFLLLGYCQHISAGILLGLTAIFQMVLAQAHIRQLPVDECGCFGGGLVHLTLLQSFALDTFLALVLIQVATSNFKGYSLDKWAYR